LITPEVSGLIESPAGLNFMTKVRVRMAPTPSGLLHLGTAHTALFNWLFARHHKGKFILRIDDSDLKRCKKEYEKDILASLKWLGIDWDEGPDIGGPYRPYRQSERMGRYWQYIERILREKKAYYCFCRPEELEEARKKMLAKGLAPKYSGRCRNLNPQQVSRFLKQGQKPAVRLKVGPGEVSFIDPSRGRIAVRAQDIGDFIIARGDKTALLATATTIDDIEMKITHTIRGEDYLNFVPRQILLYQALGFKPPVFAHLAFIYGPDGKKLSKRHGATAVSDYRSQGYLPEALVNYLVLLGWSPKDDREILNIKEVIRLFDLKDVRDAGPRFDFKKLDWLNGVYIRKKSTQDLVQLFKPFAPKGMSLDLISKTVPLVKERVKKLADYSDLVDFLVKKRKPKVDDLIQKGKSAKETRAVLLLVLEKLSQVSEKEWNSKTIEKAIRDLLGEIDWKKKDLFMTLRVAGTGTTITPPLFESISLLGRKQTLSRLYSSVNFLT
jgi:nondiscriminating glutamyl-tRNA synthetase